MSAWQAALGPYLTRMLETGRYPTVAYDKLAVRYEAIIQLALIRQSLRP